MGLLDLFRRKTGSEANPVSETRATGTGFTAMLMGARQAYITGVSGIGELTATAQTCVSLWESGFSIADVDGTDLLTPHALAVTGRSLALRGEAVFLIADRLIPATDWELATTRGRPRAYRLTLPDAGGGTSETALAAEVLHFRCAPDPAQPWTGQAPLRRAALTAGLLQEIEQSLSDAYMNAPLGSQVIPFPEAQDVDLQTLGAEFRGKRGRVLIRESVNVSAAGGPAPQQDWKPQQTTPDLRGMEPAAMLDRARDAIANAFGVLPSLLVREAQGPQTREAQRHLAQWTLQPLAVQMAQEASEKLGASVAVDVLRPTQAYDAGGRARAAATILEAMAAAQAAGLDPAQVNAALTLVNWGADDGAA